MVMTWWRMRGVGSLLLATLGCLLGLELLEVARHVRKACDKLTVRTRRQRVRTKEKNVSARQFSTNLKKLPSMALSTQRKRMVTRPWSRTTVRPAELKMTSAREGGGGYDRSR